jgi:glutamate synthase domain-containing protein 1
MRANDLGYDSCALMAHLSAHPTRQGIERVLEGLECMEHRTGIVTGESDGVGVMVDVPRDLWAKHVGDLAYAPNFWVAHLFLPPSQATAALERVAAILQADGWQIVAQRWHAVCSEALGACARREEPVFVQIAGLMPEGEPCPERALFQRHLRIERETAAHVVSLSRWSVVYKAQGGARTLRAYYPDLQSLKLTSAITIGHSRYSTNTMPAFARVQPFSVLAHNGEINTIDCLRREARQLGVRLSVGGSDSQDTDRLLHHLLVEYGLSLAEALETYCSRLCGRRWSGCPSRSGRSTATSARFWDPWRKDPPRLSPAGATRARLQPTRWDCARCGSCPPRRGCMRVPSGRACRWRFSPTTPYPSRLARRSSPKSCAGRPSSGRQQQKTPSFRFPLQAGGTERARGSVPLAKRQRPTPRSVPLAKRQRPTPRSVPLAKRQQPTPRSVPLAKRGEP